jgi:hypothetical protein
MEPRLEPIGVAQRPQLAPGTDVRGLDGVFGKIEIAQDPIGDPDAAVAGCANERFEGVLVALLRLLDQPSIHCPLRAIGAPG